MSIVRSVLIVLSVLAPALAAAQPLGTFRWQLQPYCNVVTVRVTEDAGVYHLDGTDDLCGTGPAASAIGTAFRNPDGSIGFGLTIVPAPSGSPVHVGAAIQLGTLSGTWRDSAGHTGAFVFTPGAAAPGDPRPAVTLGLSGVSLGYGLARGGLPGQESVSVDMSAVRSHLQLRESSSGSIGFGRGALVTASADAYRNVAVGEYALGATSTGDANTAVGSDALGSNTIGGANTALGSFALRINTDGHENTALGSSALEDLTVGTGNTAVGMGALLNLVSGNYNLAVGDRAATSLLLGSYNTYLGSGGGPSTESYTVRIGYNDPGSRAFIHGIRGRTTGVNNAIPVVVDSAGQLGTVSSSRRYKEGIEDLGDAAAWIQGLRPVRFRYTEPFADGGKPVQYGLIAEEVEAVAPGLVAYDAGGRPETVLYHVLPTLLVSEVQRLERERDAQASRIEALERALALIGARVEGQP